MKKRRWNGIGLLAAVLALSFAFMPIKADAKQYKPEISIETDKEQYSQDAVITETVKIRNTVGGTLSDIRIQGNIPKGYESTDELNGSKQWSKTIQTIESGDSAEIEVTFTKAKTDTEKNPSCNCLDKNKRKQPFSFFPFSDYIKNAQDFFCNHKIQDIIDTITRPGCWSMPGVNFTSKTIMVDGEKVTLIAKMTYSIGSEEEKTDLSYEGYELKWEDQFDGDSLNREDWNVELHDPGWVNNELQAYVDSEENIYIQDGSLVLKPIETVNADGSKSYTSGRVNTQNKHDFKYGLFEARVKVPEGQGFLPAFWMMPTNENLYGQWPRCGEIDIMEVLGNDTDTSYGTIHYGNPHSESQGKYTLDEGTFAEDYHIFNVEWEPGSIKWYVDGKLIHEENDWYSATEGQGELTYPAPFDQPFYMILNLAVGGNWPGNPDETTDIENAALYIDYVKAYQKDSYDENVTKPVEEVVLRDPDANGNYIVNGDFAVQEDLTDDKDWTFLTALGGEGLASIENNEIIIKTDNEGTVDYSVQLVQPNLPLAKGGVYELSFDAYASDVRTMKVDVSAPDRGYRRYFGDETVELTQEKKTYKYEFTMTDKDDANGRLEFNMGIAGSTADIKISNVSLKKTKEIIIGEGDKVILADGNYVYNGSFQEGEGRLGYWNVSGNPNAKVSVTNENNIRRLKVEAPEGTTAENPVIISQDKLALVAGEYAVSFTAEGETGKHVKMIAAEKTFIANLAGNEEKYNYKLELDSQASNTDVAFVIEETGVFYIDNVRIEEDSLIKNGSFNAGWAGYEPYVDSSISSEVTYVIDSLNEDNAADFSIGNTGDQDWKIQLKQNNIPLEKGQWYRLSLDAKSSIDRKMMIAIQRDGSADNDWNPYSGQKIVDLTNNYQTFDIEFQMNSETDLKSVLSISMGAVEGKQITEKHRICIDNIKLDKIDEPEESGE